MITTGYTALVRAPYASIQSMGELVNDLPSRHIELCFRDLARGPGMVLRTGSVCLITGEPHPFGNLAIFAEIGDFEEIRVVAESLVQASVPAGIAICGEPSLETIEYLNSQGFEAHGETPAMAVDLKELQPGSLPTGYEFCRLVHAAESGEWVQVVSEGYPVPLGMAKRFCPERQGVNDDPGAAVQFFVIRKDGKAVSASFLYLAEGVAGMYFVATLPEERGKGLGGYVTGEPLRIARDLGYGVGVLQASPEGERVYRKLGFRQYGGIPIYLRLAGLSTS